MPAFKEPPANAASMQDFPIGRATNMYLAATRVLTRWRGPLQVYAKLTGGHKNAITALLPLGSTEPGGPDRLVSAAADGTIAVWQPSTAVGAHWPSEHAMETRSRAEGPLICGAAPDMRAIDALVPSNQGGGPGGAHVPVATWKAHEGPVNSLTFYRHLEENPEQPPLKLASAGAADICSRHSASLLSNTDVDFRHWCHGSPSCCTGEDKKVCFWDTDKWKFVSGTRPLPKGSVASLMFSGHGAAAFGDEPCLLMVSEVGCLALSRDAPSR